MATPTGTTAGRVVAIWRYPVKSMLGEELNASDITERGLLGDRAFALIDEQTGKVASAKNPRTWPGLFDCRAAFVAPPDDPRSLPAARITLADGSQVMTDGPDAGRLLSDAVGRPVRLASSAPEGATAEGYWPDHDWLDRRDEVFDFSLPPGTFFDMGAVHLLATTTLDHLRSLAPEGRFEARRFRPNLVIATADGSDGFVEDTWLGRTLRIGDEVRLKVTDPCPRCVMTTLAQGDLPRDPGILRTAARHHEGNVGVYAAVLRGGRVRRGDAVEPE